MKIETERFYLRPLEEKDATNTYLSWLENSENQRHIIHAKDSNSILKLKNYISEKSNKDNIWFLGIFTKDHIHIGNIKYEPIDLVKKFSIMGILIGDNNYKGKGVAGEVILETAKRLKGIGIEYISLGVDINNIPAIKSYGKIGFKKTEGHFISIKDGCFEMILELKNV